ncbi:methyltransferase domain-containing protein [Roseibium denhamense]|uniref:Phosphatidylethanolamine/phosphatidyl-N-methylethanolamine N-methyltransferase n=1 Tax=Roseibium denhamense TaxID=76305 RepID=A0ABY1PP33_9HYPH|nr:methyltransferase domain-containing protein [Roseibium denhamense]MTI06948.1 methyltransferase domain-containing protein [Roseibium denhamense]SMP36716.1 phosphatidylethanolamine/phosphatidyl-N-methylethanolamine N-methyltransferase [Roseibium denhamense]
MLKRFGAERDFVKSKLVKANLVRSKMLDEVKFLRSWAQNPLRTGAVSPSRPELAAKMASYLVPGPHTNVIELGPGTGVVTKALFDQGIAQKNITAVEFSPAFCTLLAKRYPGLNVIQGDAYSLQATLAAAYHETGPKKPLLGAFDGIVSSLPLLTRPETERQQLLSEALDILKPGAPFIQFSYGFATPVKPVGAGVSIFSSEWIWKNLPPARVWVFRKGH